MICPQMSVGSLWQGLAIPSLRRGRGFLAFGCEGGRFRPGHPAVDARVPPEVGIPCGRQGGLQEH